ncbi:MAG: hypothetical protein LBN07_04115 [Christensenellaceae bacterium]|nr:hypothetical protein [Christensenellaceae bacterium]
MKKSEVKFRTIFFSVFAAVFLAAVIIGAFMVNSNTGDDETYAAVKVALEKQGQQRGYQFEAQITTTYTDGSRDIVLYDQTEDWDTVSGYREVDFLKRQLHEDISGQSSEVLKNQYNTRVVRYLEDFWYLVEYADESIPNTKMRVDRNFAGLHVPTQTDDLDPVNDLRYNLFYAKECLVELVKPEVLNPAKKAIEEFNNQNSGTKRELTLNYVGGEFILSLKETTGTNYVLYTVFVSMNSVDKITYQSYSEEPDGTVILSDFGMTIKKNMKQFNHAITLQQLEDYVEINTLVTLKPRKH